MKILRRRVHNFLRQIIWNNEIEVEFISKEYYNFQHFPKKYLIVQENHSRKQCTQKNDSYDNKD